MGRQLSLVYLILVHADPAQLRRLIKRLESHESAFFVHVDGKADITAFRRATKDINRTYFCESRSKVTWAAFSVVEATLRLLEAALTQEVATDSRFVLLSGADYAIASNREILHFFARRPKREFVRGFAIREAGESQRWRIEGRHFRELAPRHSWLRPPLFAIERSLRLFQRRLPSDIVFVCGSQWWALTRDCAQFCLDFARENPDLLRFFKSTFAPDETFFHTIVHNSPYAQEADPLEPFVDDVIRSGSLRFYSNLHYLPGTWIHTQDDARAALTALPRKLFARKFSSAHSIPAMDFIDQSLDTTTRLNDTPL
jgi:Core-2/I-Branching enzyme